MNMGQANMGDVVMVLTSHQSLASYMVTFDNLAPTTEYHRVFKCIGTSYASVVYAWCSSMYVSDDILV